VSEYPTLSGRLSAPSPLASATTGWGRISTAGGGGVGVDLASSSKQMKESTGREESVFTDQRYSGLLPVEENKETMAGWTDPENIVCRQTDAPLGAMLSASSMQATMTTTRVIPSPAAAHFDFHLFTVTSRWARRYLRNSG
jgi:hypothetical protein